MPKLYIDTNILVYTIVDSKNPYNIDISSSSSKLFWDVASCKHHVIISSWALRELAKLNKLEHLNTVFSIVQKKIIKIDFTQEDIQQAKKQSPEHFQDELHAILALKSNADYIITRNISDFTHYKDKIKIAKPEELL